MSSKSTPKSNKLAQASAKSVDKPTASSLPPAKSTADRKSSIGTKSKSKTQTQKGVAQGKGAGSTESVASSSDSGFIKDRKPGTKKGKQPEDSQSTISESVDTIASEGMKPEHNFAVMSQLKLTKPAPEFSGTAVKDGEFKTISLSDYKGKYLVFFFYPLDFTFVCPTEIIAFSDRAEEFRSINCEVVACSTDSHFSHLAWINTPRKQGGLGDMKIPLLADKNCSIAQAYGVYKDDDGIAFRGLFIIDDKGNLRQITINDLPVGRSVDETLRLVQAFQFTDKHGEVCPAGWKPGKDTMKPDVKGSKGFFQKNM